MTRRLRVVALCLFALSGSVTTIGAQTLYGAVPGETSPLYVIDPVTGVGTPIGDIGFGITALAFHPITGELYGTQAGVPGGGPGAFDRNLIRINKTTGQGTIVGPIGLGIGGIADIAFRSDGTLFGWSENTDALITINTTTGAGTLIGSDPGISTRGSGLAFNAAGTLYLAGNNGSGPLRTVNTTTGLTTVGPILSGAPHPTQPVPAMKFHPVTDVLWAVNRQVAGTGITYLITIDTRTGAITTINPTVSRLDGLAWDNATPVAVADAYSVAFGTPLTVPAPGVLANDDDRGAASLTASLVSSPANGALVLNADGSFTYAPAPGFHGADSFTYRGISEFGEGNVATVTLTVALPTVVQPPTGLFVSAMSGNTVTLRFDAPLIGPAATGYLLEGGLSPGQVLASIPTGSASPIFTILAPTGSFYVRMHSTNGTQKSAASNEIRIHVNVPVPPSAPEKLTTTVSGNTIMLSWRNTFTGGAPTSLLVGVTGSFVEEFSFAVIEGTTFPPPLPPLAGTYTVTVRAANAGGVSSPTAPITLTAPASCPGPPLPPSRFLLYRIGGTGYAVWEPPASGPAVTGYVLNVTGSFVGSFTTTGRALSGAIGPGSYTVTVVAVNHCGSSSPTAAQTLVVP